MAKKYLILLLILLITPFSFAKSYSLTNYDLNYTLDSSGVVFVSEKLEYNLVGCFKELFLERPNTIISEPNGYCQGADCIFEYKTTNTVSKNPELILKGDFCNTKVTAFFSYTLINQIVALEDGSQFYYKVYPGKTAVSTNANINIIFPEDINKTTRFIHSKNYQQNTSGNILNISKYVKVFEIIEVNILMPKDWFNPDNLFQDSNRAYTKSQIIAKEQNWQEDYDAYNKAQSLPSTKKYEINNYDVNYTLNKSGTIDISEKIDYSVKGCITELSIQRFDVNNPSGYCSGDINCIFEYKEKNTQSGNPELILTGYFCDTNIITYFNYNLEKTLIGLIDGTLLNRWMYADRVGVSANVNLYIFFPGDVNQVTVFFNPSDLYKQTHGNQLYYTGKINSYEGIYLTALMPKDWFDQNNIYHSDSTVIQIIETETQKQKQIEEQKQKQIEEQKQKQIEEQRLIKKMEEQRLKLIEDQTLINEINVINQLRFLMFKKEITNWFLNYLFMFLGLFTILIIIWLIFGKELSLKKINYFGIYERNLPGNEDPLQANYIITGEFSKDWFSSAILYLVWKKQYDLEKKSDNYFLIKNKAVKIENLPSYVKKIDDFFNKYYPNGKIDLEQLKNRLNPKSFSSKDYVTNYKEIKNQSYDFRLMYQEIYNEYERWFNKKSKYFNITGYYIATIIFTVFFIVTFFLNAGYFMFTILITIIASVILSLIPHIFKFKLIFGRFSKEGRIKNLQWTNFKKYITDFSLMKEHPPKRVILWEEYMVYATAFGVAKQTSKVLKIVMPQEIKSSNDFIISSSFSATSSEFSEIGGFFGGDSGGFGGGSSGGGSSGGGFGGGGGGGGAGAR